MNSLSNYITYNEKIKLDSPDRIWGKTPKMGETYFLLTGAKESGDLF